MNQTYDYIIAGAGSAGWVLANRPGEIDKFSVLILEAGGIDDKFWNQTPIGYGQILYDNKTNLMYTTLTSGNTNAPTIMVDEKATELILNAQ